MKSHIRILAIALAMLCSISVYSQSRTKIVVLDIETRDLLTDPVTMGNLVRLEVQQSGDYEVVSRYDIMDELGEAALKDCYSKKCLSDVATKMGAHKAIGGEASRIGEKIVINLTLVDVRNDVIERAEIGEFINEESQIQKMVEITVNNIFGKENDPMIVGGLTYITTVSDVSTSRIINNGPRMGVAYLIGDMADRFQAPEDLGGYDVYPMLSQFGYQHEFQYLSSGNFQALAEVLFLVSGLEQSRVIPSLVIMNGFRESKLGFEFGFGPSISIRTMSDGYFVRTTDGNIDSDYVKPGEQGRIVEIDGHKLWKLESEWEGVDKQGNPMDNPFTIEKQLDSRGDVEFFSRWIWSVGKTFRSGSLNIPVNVYAAPLRDNWMVGMSVGFNVQRKRR